VADAVLHPDPDRTEDRRFGLVWGIACVARVVAAAVTSARTGAWVAASYPLEESDRHLRAIPFFWTDRRDLGE
jgi:hypothetical protein